MTEHQPSDDLIARVLAGEGTAAESAAVERWAASSTEARASLDRLRQAWASPAEPPGWDVDRAWTVVSARIESGDHPIEVIPIPRAKPTIALAWRIAALLAVVVGVGFAWRALGSPEAAFVTAAAEVRAGTLDDGTVVVLEVSARFEQRRTVRLEGEAWFAIAPGAGAPFTVDAGDYRVRDIGTAFSLRARHADSLEVAVVEGIVLVEREAGGSDTLRAGAVADFGAGGSGVMRAGATAAAVAGWRDGAFEFTAVPAGQVVARLAEWHGVALSVADPAVAARAVTVTLPANSLDDALDVLSVLLGVGIDRRDGSIVLR